MDYKKLKDEPEKVSNCCGSEVINETCTECKEHCEEVDEQ